MLSSLPTACAAATIAPGVERALADVGGDLTAFWNRHRESGEKFTEWRGVSAFAFAPTGPGTADFVQISLGREREHLAGPVVDRDYRPTSADQLFEPTWVSRESAVEARQLAGPVYRLRGRTGGGIVHMRSFLARRRIEREQREASRPELENRVIHEVGSVGVRDIPFLDANPDWFDFFPRENRFFADWARSSSAAARIFDHWAFDIHDFEGRGQKREIGFIPRPLKHPAEKLLAGEGVSVHRLMERIEAIDEEVGLPFAWLFLMTHGHWVDPDVGYIIADGLRAGRVRLPDKDAAVLLAWADRPYLF
ncbi:hypothetical protein [Mesorhizobium sp. M0854]|uniref:hypothetical protein n=1 Tax=Mesorhizobium sp. M0854 TaxID=2957013 RepID=UPI0033376E07